MDNVSGEIDKFIRSRDEHFANFNASGLDFTPTQAFPFRCVETSDIGKYCEQNDIKCSFHHSLEAHGYVFFYAVTDDVGMFKLKLSGHAPSKNYPIRVKP